METSWGLLGEPGGGKTGGSRGPEVPLGWPFLHSTRNAPRACLGKRELAMSAQEKTTYLRGGKRITRLGKMGARKERPVFKNTNDRKALQGATGEAETKVDIGWLRTEYLALFRTQADRQGDKNGNWGWTLTAPSRGDIQKKRRGGGEFVLFVPPETSFKDLLWNGRKLCTSLKTT